MKPACYLINLRNIKKLKMSLVLSCMIMLASCSTTLYYDRIIPPEIVIRVSPCRIAMVNLFDYTLPDSPLKKYKKIYRTSINSFAMELLKNNSSDSLMKFVIADTLKTGYSPDNLTLILPVDSVTGMTSEYKADYLLTVDSVSLFLKTDEDYSETEEGLLQKVYGDTYFVDDFFLSLYDSSGNLVDRSEVAMNSVYEKGYMLYPGGSTSIKKELGLAGNLASAAADDYLNKYYPGSTTERKKIYTGRIFRESNTLIMKREWDKAEEILKRISDSPNKMQAKRARYNFSVLEEVKESIAPARDDNNQ